jgi:hypothetical protein
MRGTHLIDWRPETMDKVLSSMTREPKILESEIRSHMREMKKKGIGGGRDEAIRRLKYKAEVGRRDIQMWRKQHDPNYKHSEEEVESSTSDSSDSWWISPSFDSDEDEAPSAPTLVPSSPKLQREDLGPGEVVKKRLDDFEKVMGDVISQNGKGLREPVSWELPLGIWEDQGNGVRLFHPGQTADDIRRQLAEDEESRKAGISERGRILNERSRVAPPPRPPPREADFVRSDPMAAFDVSEGTHMHSKKLNREFDALLDAHRGLPRTHEMYEKEKEMSARMRKASVPLSEYLKRKSLKEAEKKERVERARRGEEQYYPKRKYAYEPEQVKEMVARKEKKARKAAELLEQQKELERRSLEQAQRLEAAQRRKELLAHRMRPGGL